jgi:hypothetical protein
MPQQMVCRIAKPSDSITLVHIPVIYPPFGGKVGPDSNEGGRQDTEKHAYFTLHEYEHQYRRCVRRIEHLLSVYKNAGYNLYVDTVPTFQEEMSRQLVYIQRKNYFHAQLVQRQRELRIKQAPVLSRTPSPASVTPSSSPPRGKGKSHSMKMMSPAASVRSLPAPAVDNSMETNIAVRLFVQNQHTYHLATRVLAVARRLEASFLVLGVGSADILKAITAPAASTRAREAPVARNLNFPFNQVVADNSRPHETLDGLMSARRALRLQGKPAPDSGYWLDEFMRYSDQKIDLAEMVLHQYGHQRLRASSALLHPSQHAHDKEHAQHRFSFLLSNCDSLKQ